jgi:DNA-binding ferritin-like protein
VANHLEQQTTAYLRLIDDLVDRLKARNKEAIEEIRESIVDIRRRDEEYETIAAQRARLTIRYNGYLEQLQRTGDTLLKAYRAANRAARSTPPPKAFGDGWKSGWTKEEIIKDTSVEERKRTVKELLEAISQSQERLLAVFLKALQEYEKLRDLHAARDKDDGRT